MATDVSAQVRRRDRAARSRMLAKQAVILLEEGRWEQARELFLEVCKRLEAEDVRRVLQKRPLYGSNE